MGRESGAGPQLCGKINTQRCLESLDISFFTFGTKKYIYLHSYPIYQPVIAHYSSNLQRRPPLLGVYCGVCSRVELGRGGCHFTS